MLRSDLTAAIARAVGTALALVLPAAVVAMLRLFPPLMLEPTEPSGWLAPATLGIVALCAAVSVVLLLGALVTTGRLAAGAAGLSATALTAGCAALALGGPDTSVTMPNSGLALTLNVVAIGFAVVAWAGPRMVQDERGRWLGVILALVLAEAALAGALLAPGSALDDLTAVLFLVAGAVAAIAAAVWFGRRNPVMTFAPLTLLVSALLLAWAREGSVDAVIAMTPLVLTPPLLVLGFVPRAATTTSAAAAFRAAAAAEATAAATTAGSAGAEQLPDTSPVAAVAAVDRSAEDAERDRIGRELRAALAELTDARHTIALQRTELERAAEIDTLTGVASRTAIMDRLREEVASAKRYPHPVSIVVVDIDRMGELNALHGTATGDAVLRELALRIRVRVREADAIGRLAGDAFLAILPHTDEKGATVFAEAIRDRATQRPISTGKGEVSVTVSIGVTTMRPRQDLSADTLLSWADEAVSSARAGGGNVIAYDRLHGLARLDERRKEPPEDTELEDRRRR
jgi:diguanylate cyclase (GGDEF)-like protein